MEERRNSCILTQMRLALALLLAASSAAAAVPEKGEGTITLLGGVRTLLPGNGDYLTEQLATHRTLQPGGLASFGYQYDEELHFKIEVGYLWDRYRIAGGDLEVKSIPVFLALDTALVHGRSFTFYGGGGIGYSLNTGTRNGVSNEANSTAGYVALGLRYQLAGPVSLVIEERYTLASAQVDPQSTQRLNVGGNLFSLGFMFHFLEPDEAGKPKAP
ncbi:MAG: porin family protein [Deltaproteobacteria bacterium]|nr:MAG: porin family protein [Deltaproteobacteria bacterium]